MFGPLGPDSLKSDRELIPQDELSQKSDPLDHRHLCWPGITLPTACSRLILAVPQLIGEEVEEGLVQLIGVRPADVVWSALNLDEPDVAHEVGEASAGGVDGQDA